MPGRARRATRSIITLGLAAFAQAALAAGSGVFNLHSTAPGFGGAGESVGLADLNGDGHLDAVVAGASSTTVWVGSGSGTFSPHPCNATLPATGTVAFGDVDDDQRIDIVVSGSVFLGSATCLTEPPSSPFGSAGHVALGDLDGDGDLDAVLDGTVWRNNGSGTFTAHSTPSFSSVPFTSVGLGDMDGDGDLDVVATGNQHVYVFRNNGSGVFAEHPGSPFGTANPNKVMQQAALGDVDGDGDLDVLAVLTDLVGGTSTNLVHRNDGTGGLAPPASFAGNTRVALANVDADGDLDALTDVATGVWRNSGTGTFTAHPTPTDFGTSVTSIALGDVDGDGDLDALVTHASSATAVWLNVNAVNYDIFVSASPPAGGTASCTPDPVPSGGSSTCSASANAGYTFTGWSGHCSGSTCTLSNVTSPRSVTASFSLNTYPIVTAASPSGGGTVSCTSNPAPHGGSSTCTANANPGFTFDNWSGDCSGSGCVLTNITSAKSVTAHFSAVASSYPVTAMASPSNGGTVSCSPNPVPHGGSSTCTATANAGFAFSGWSGDCAGSSCTLSNVTSTRSVTASFTPLDPSGPPRLGNISTRGHVLTGNDVMIGGFVIGGSTSKTVAIVATGPSLSSFGIANPMANPTLTLVRSSDQAIVGSNNDWQSDPNAPQLQAEGFGPSHPSEAGMLVTLPPGAYTAIVQGFGGGTGVAVVGVYEVDHPETPLANISTRARVGTGNDVVIGGFVVQGSGPQTLAIVATGPSLASHGIASPLANPTLTLVRSSDQTVVATNDDWQTDPNASQLQAAGFAPPNALESGLYVTLQPGAYTAIVSGVGGGTGIAVVGVYRVN
jgi:uncharacterized repeat protein (TIGR02543 family)